MEIEFKRIVDIAHSSNQTRLIEKFTESLKRIKTTGQLKHFLISKINSNKRGKMIGVQPTSCTRTKVRANFESGRKRIQSGRPAKAELIKNNSKRSHNLIRNIEQNIPHAKQH
ncbi:hypothetical protein ABEB36_000225 [Hypothenemus hampei]|uniref:Uncharacterized protein n=1 Tax=Hypothenemus hampei TaxID=57062 RepID=A0ABD1FAL9_HYPHA